MMKTRVASLAVLVAATLGAGCASSTLFQSSWPNPDARPATLRGKKVAALLMSPDKSLRYSVEASLSRELTSRGAIGVPAYTLIPEDQTQDEGQVKALLTRAGVEGVVSMRVTSADTQVTRTPGYWTSRPYGTFWRGYYRWGWGAVYAPGYLRTERVVSVETLVYDLDQDALLWAGMSTTASPSKIDSFVRQLVSAAATEIRSAGLVAE